MYININPDLFLGTQEINRLIQSLDDDGFRKLFLKNSIQFGLFDNSIGGEFDNGQISQGTNIGTIKNNALFAVNNLGNIIYRPETDNILLTNDNNWYWIKLSHLFSPIESYLVSIDKSGNLSAPGGSLTEILRGNPNNPSRISFPNSTLNTLEYDVQEVIDDENALLSGDFLAETELQLAVVGSFTPGISVPTDSKYPFQYDSCTLTAVLESVLNTPPTLIDGEEFLLARVKRNGSTITIQDKRGLNIYRDKADYALSNVPSSNNALIGVESVRYDSNNTPRDKNLVQIAWTFRSSNWTVDSSVNRITLIAGLGGKFKSTSDFTDGDFDGWRLYTEDGTYYTIKQSSLSATQINLILDTLDVDKFANLTQKLIVAPNSESIKLIFTGDSSDSDGIDLGDEILEFPINQEFAVVPLLVFEDPSYYNIKYSYKNFVSYSDEVAIPSDLVSGYLVESSFDINGVQTGTTRQTYTSDEELGFIILNLAANAYSNRIASIETGDLFGIQYKELNNAIPIYSLNVGLNNQVQIFRTTPIIDAGFGDPYTLTVDHYIDLRTDATGIKNGNSFILKFSGDYVKGAFNIFITQNYVNSGDVGTIKYTFAVADYDLSRYSQLFFKVSFDGVDWLVEKIILDLPNTSGLPLFFGNMNQLDLSGPFFIQDIATNKPLATGGLCYSNIFDEDYGTQTFIQYDSNKFFFRRRIPGGGVWDSWIELATSAGSVAPTRTLTAGNGLSGGGDLSANRTFDVNADNSTIEINSDTLRVKAGGITNSHLAAGVAVANLGYTPYNSSNPSGYISGISSGDVVSALSYTPANSGRNLVAGNGLSGGGDLSADRSFDVNVDNFSVQTNSDAIRLPNGYKAVQSPDGGQVYTKKLSASGWNADTTDQVSIAHGLDYTKIYKVCAVIFTNSGIPIDPDSALFNPVNPPPANHWETWHRVAYVSYNSTNIIIGRMDGSLFDSASFNAASVKVLVFYEP